MAKAKKKTRGEDRNTGKKSEKDRKIKPDTAKERLLIFLKGILMGICDIIPGISGGTIAFVTGIYKRLIDAVRSFSWELVKNTAGYLKNPKKNKKRFYQSVKKLDLPFLVILLLGIGLSVIVGSGIIKNLLETHYATTISFFVGLILASSRIIYQNIKNHKAKNIAFGLVGLAIGITLAYIIPADFTPNLPLIFLGGFLAISAMFLPGISGAFILLIMGLYEFMLNVIHNMIGHIDHMIVFVLGAATGAVTISRIIAYFFKKDRCKTLYVLLGLVIGSLAVPFRKIEYANLDMIQTISMILLFLLGVIAVIIVDKIAD